ncbi:CHAP domain-containing protein [Bailinhaonella thermotolerans]|uniref:CHAP domain-containing protein n=1 Tax=Bailinhaonella thermotolerans TaxID=1070861 RepID=A0A3A4B872_9ACTN|nr:CHAP domain-containing protein [Bailinhaonella thermotolerans]RJL30318.1 CHAP domain-containing protein [Bailinhaonella thermotolerans]
MDPVGKKLLDVAKSQLGYREKADGYTKFGEWYMKNIDGDNEPYFKTAPWCDMFLAWAADRAGVEHQAGQFASTIQHAKWFKQQDAWGTKPKPGAIVFFNWAGSKDLDDIQHVGIVEKVVGGQIHTIEGNTDRVHLKRKIRDADQIVGYGYPSQVKVIAEPAPAPAVEKYVPRHAAPAPAAETLNDATPDTVSTIGKDGLSAQESFAQHQEAILGGLLAAVLFGTVAIAVGRNRASKLRNAPPVRIRKRGAHHKVAAPVSLPAEVTVEDLEDAGAQTFIMPAISAQAAQAAEDREFWGRIAHLEEDEELAFWNTLHDEVSQSAGITDLWEPHRPVDRAPAPEFVPGP